MTNFWPYVFVRTLNLSYRWLITVVFSLLTKFVFEIAVANGNFKRWILASENMKVGDLIKTYNEIPRNPVQVGEMIKSGGWYVNEADGWMD